MPIFINHFILRFILEKERKQQILKAAIKRFAKHGLKKTTLEEVARDLRIGKATIYHYFKSKEDLYFGCLYFEAALFIEELKNIFNNDSISAGRRFADYFSLKENIAEKYKLIYAFLAEELKGGLFDNEKELLTKFMAEENAIIKAALKPVYTNKTDFSLPNFSNFIIINSWSLLFASRITGPIDPAGMNKQREILLKLLEPYIGL